MRSCDLIWRRVCFLWRRLCTVVFIDFNVITHREKWTVLKAKSELFEHSDYILFCFLLTFQFLLNQWINLYVTVPTLIHTGVLVVRVKGQCSPSSELPGIQFDNLTSDTCLIWCEETNATLNTFVASQVDVITCEAGVWPSTAPTQCVTQGKHIMCQALRPPLIR